jgi:hypothetical protein
VTGLPLRRPSSLGPDHSALTTSDPWQATKPTASENKSGSAPHPASARPVARSPHARQYRTQAAAHFAPLHVACTPGNTCRPETRLPRQRLPLQNTARQRRIQRFDPSVPNRQLGIDGRVHPAAPYAQHTPQARLPTTRSTPGRSLQYRERHYYRPGLLGSCTAEHAGLQRLVSLALLTAIPARHGQDLVRAHARIRRTAQRIERPLAPLLHTIRLPGFAKNGTMLAHLMQGKPVLLLLVGPLQCRSRARGW